LKIFKFYLYKTKCSFFWEQAYLGTVEKFGISYCESASVGFLAIYPTFSQAKENRPHTYTVFLRCLSFPLLLTSIICGNDLLSFCLESPDDSEGLDLKDIAPL
jgi:hypothetical protein